MFEKCRSQNGWAGCGRGGAEMRGFYYPGLTDELVPETASRSYFCMVALKKKVCVFILNAIPWLRFLRT